MPLTVDPKSKKKIQKQSNITLGFSRWKAVLILPKNFQTTRNTLDFFKKLDETVRQINSEISRTRVPE